MQIKKIIRAAVKLQDFEFPFNKIIYLSIQILMDTIYHQGPYLYIEYLSTK